MQFRHVANVMSALFCALYKFSCTYMFLLLRYLFIYESVYPFVSCKTLLETF